MKIAITIEANSPKELITQLRATIASFESMTTAVPSQRPTVNEDQPVSGVQEAPATIPAPAEPEVSLETVRALLVELNQAGKQEQIKRLLAKYGADRLSGVKPEDYSRLYTDAQELAS